MNDQMGAIKDILGAALSDLTPQQLAALTMESFADLLEELEP